ncbi:MAG: Hpt domain-containing protein [Gammaproteobacteria bacterium]|nr:Hpt domain-containing protein [Gammaproteobacteria bacterium]
MLQTNQPQALPESMPSQTPPAEDSLPELPGIDTQAGLKVARNKLALYRKLLLLFHDTKRDFAAEFSNAHAAGDAEAATRAAHSLKGVAANIGALQLAEAAKDLELACREQNAEVEPLFQQVLAELKPVLEGIERL